MNNDVHSWFNTHHHRTTAGLLEECVLVRVCGLVGARSSVLPWYYQWVTVMVGFMGTFLPATIIITNQQRTALGKSIHLPNLGTGRNQLESDCIFGFAVRRKRAFASVFQSQRNRKANAYLRCWSELMKLKIRFLTIERNSFAWISYAKRKASTL